MPKAKLNAHLFELAKRGAESRLRDLVNELKLLTSTFPHLRDSFDADELPINFILRRGSKKGRVKPPKRHTWTAAQRKAVSERMKAYWTKRRRAK